MGIPYVPSYYFYFIGEREWTLVCWLVLKGLSRWYEVGTSWYLGYLAGFERDLRLNKAKQSPRLNSPEKVMGD